MKAILIARVSDKEQRKALPAQKLRLVAYANEKAMKYDYRQFDESAYKDDRKKFEELVHDIEKNKQYQIIVFDKIDRFTRDSSQRVVSTIKNLVRSGDLELHFPHDHLCLDKNSSAIEWFQLEMGMSLAAYYSGSIRDNVKRRFDQMVNDGLWIGAATLGYLNTQEEVKGKLIKGIVVDRHRAPFIVKIFEMRAQEVSYGVIAARMNELGLRTKRGARISKALIEKITRNPFYYGSMLYKGKLYEHKYEPLISRRLFNQCQDVRSKRYVQRTHYDSLEHTFDDIVRCGLCGHVVSSYTSRGNVYMKCSHRCRNNTAQALVMSTAEEAVDRPKLPSENLPLVIENLKARHDDQRTFFDTTVAETQRAYEKNKERVKQLTYEKLDGGITPELYAELIADINGKQDELESKLNSLTSDDQRVEITSSYLIDLAQRAATLFSNSTEALQQKLLRVILSNMQLTDKKLTYNYSNAFQALIDLKKMTLDGPNNENWCG